MLFYALFVIIYIIWVKDKRVCFMDGDKTKGVVESKSLSTRPMDIWISVSVRNGP